MIKAIFLDHDGVLVNSMPYHVKAWQKVFGELNITIAPEDILLTEGRRSFEVARKILEDRQYEVSEDVLVNLVKRKQLYYQEITEAKLQPGAEELIRFLKQKGIKIGLVTGSHRGNVEATLNPEILSKFDVIIAGDEVKQGKPDPEAYLKAAKAVNVEPDQCLVIENAPLGIQAAKNAGMKVVALTTTLDRSYLKDADFIAEGLVDLLAYWSVFSN